MDDPAGGCGAVHGTYLQLLLPHGCSARFQLSGSCRPRMRDPSRQIIIHGPMRVGCSYPPPQKKHTHRAARPSHKARTRTESLSLRLRSTGLTASTQYLGEETKQAISGEGFRTFCSRAPTGFDRATRSAPAQGLLSSLTRRRPPASSLTAAAANPIDSRDDNAAASRTCSFDPVATSPCVILSSCNPAPMRSGKRAESAVT